MVGFVKMGKVRSPDCENETEKRAQKRRDLKIYRPRARPVLAGFACGARQAARFYAGKPQFFSGLRLRRAKYPHMARWLRRSDQRGYRLDHFVSQSFFAALLAAKI